MKAQTGHSGSVGGLVNAPRALARRLFAVAVPLLLACGDATPDALDRDTAGSLTAVHVVPGDTFAVFPSPGGSLFLETVRGMALAEDGRSVYVLDAHTVHHLDLDGNLLGSMGGEGEGPGELKSPSGIQPAIGGGAWVYDPGNGRAMRYGEGAEVVEQVSGIEQPSGPFVPFGDGIVLSVVPRPTGSVSGRDVVITPGEPSKERLLSYYFGTGDMLEISSPPGVPDALVEGGLMGRIVGWSMAAISPNEIAVVISGRDLSTWRLVLDDGGERIDTIAELPVPSDVRRIVRETSEMGGPDVMAMTIRGARMVGGRLWVVAGGLGYGPDKPLTFSIPLNGGTTSLRLDREPVDPHREVVDAIVLPDRLILATQIEVTFLTIAPA